MSSRRRPVRLGDVVDLSWGNTSITKASYIEDGFQAYSASGPDGYLRHFEYEGVGIVLSAIGAQCGKTWLAAGKWTCIKNTMRVLPKDATVDIRFIYLALSDPAKWPKRGSAQPFISQTEARDVTVDVPAIEEQRAVSSILGSLDDRIRLCREQASTLESIAAAIFKSRFVDFDGSITDSEQFGRGSVAGDWDCLSLAAQAEIFGGGTPKTSEDRYWNGDVPWVSVSDTVPGPYVTETARAITDTALLETHSRTFPKDTIVITARGTVGNVALLGSDMAINQSCYALRSRGVAAPLFLYYSLKQSVHELQRSAHGSVFSTITRATFDSVKTNVPPFGAIERFESDVEPMFARILVLQRKIAQLMRIRDTLLPKLVSGELEVPASLLEVYGGEAPAAAV